MANQLCSMDFVFDRTAEGRSIKNLTLFDDATHKAVAIVTECALGGSQLVRMLDAVGKNLGVAQGQSEQITSWSSVAVQL